MTDFNSRLASTPARILGSPFLGLAGVVSSSGMAAAPQNRNLYLIRRPQGKNNTTQRQYTAHGIGIQLTDTGTGYHSRNVSPS